MATIAPRSFYGRIGKRLLDLTLTVLCLPIVAPVLLACAIAIRLDSPGPALFRQVRIGQDGTTFRVFKFRTMIENAHTLTPAVSHLNVLAAPDFKIPDDPRITRVGRLLRQTSLDELPQLFNVLAGSMSLVGPRPTDFSPDTYEVWHAERLEVPPGITGLWQIKGRDETEFDERLRLDIAYIDGFSLGTDLKILFLTIGAVIRRSGH